MEAKNNDPALDAIKNLSPTIKSMMGNVKTLMGTLETLKQHPSLSDDQRKEANSKSNEINEKMQGAMKDFKNIVNKANGK